MSTKLPFLIGLSQNFVFLVRRYETSDGQKRNEVGYFRDDATLGRILNIRGSYSYLDTDGKQVVVHYAADENGYRQQEGSPPLAPATTLSG